MIKTQFKIKTPRVMARLNNFTNYLRTNYGFVVGIVPVFAGVVVLGF